MLGAILDAQARTMNTHDGGAVLCLSFLGFFYGVAAGFVGTKWAIWRTILAYLVMYLVIPPRAKTFAERREAPVFCTHTQPVSQ